MPQKKTARTCILTERINRLLVFAAWRICWCGDCVNLNTVESHSCFFRLCVSRDRWEKDAPIRSSQQRRYDVVKLTKRPTTTTLTHHVTDVRLLVRLSIVYHFRYFAERHSSPDRKGANNGLMIQSIFAAFSGASA